MISQSDPVLGIIPGLKMPKFLSLGLSRCSHILYTACYCDILCGLSEIIKSDLESESLFFKSDCDASHLESNENHLRLKVNIKD